MTGTGADWAVVLSLASLAVGTWGVLTETPWITLAAFVLITAAILSIVTDHVTPGLTLASTATGVVFIGCAAVIAGYYIQHDGVALGGLAIAVIAFLVALAEMWEAT